VARRFDCPIPEYEGGWIEIPDTWLGKHANKRDEIVNNAPEDAQQTAVNWMVATGLMEQWGGIEAMNGNPDKWNFDEISLELIAWITQTVNGSYNQCWNVKKKYSRQSLNG
jgi:hypothetical protein